MPTTVSVRDETKDKLDAIATRRRWQMTTTLDALADFYLDHHSDIQNSSVTTCPASSPSDADTQHTDSARKSQ